MWYVRFVGSKDDTSFFSGVIQVFMIARLEICSEKGELAKVASKIEREVGRCPDVEVEW